MENKGSFGTITSLTMTLAGLADAAARESAAIANDVTRYLDALLEFTVSLSGGSATGDKAIDLYLAPSLDGTTWPDTVTGANAAYTPGDLKNLMFLGTFYAPSGTGPFRAVFPTSMGPNAALLLPPFWSIVLVNRTGRSLASGTVRFLGSQVSEE